MSYDKKAYNEEVLRRLYCAIWEYQNSIEDQDEDQALGEVILNATKYPAVVAGHIFDEIERRKQINL